MTMPDLPPQGSTSWRAPWAQWVHDQAAKVWSKLGVGDLSATGTPSATTYLRGDNTWATPAVPPSDAAAGTASLRTLGTGATQALPGNHASTTNARTPTAHSHPVTDLTATGTRSDTTFLRGDGTWAQPPTGTGGGGVTDHTALTGRSAADSHPIAAITGLQGALDGKQPAGTYATTSDVTTASTADRARANHTGTQSLDTTTDSATRLAMTAAERTKLSGVAAGATALALGNTASTAKAGDYKPPIADLPAGSVLYVDQNAGGTWPNRPTARTDVKVIWTKTVTGSADPAAATAPAVTGAYTADLVMGV